MDAPRRFTTNVATGHVPVWFGSRTDIPYRVRVAGDRTGVDETGRVPAQVQRCVRRRRHRQVRVVIAVFGHGRPSSSR